MDAETGRMGDLGIWYATLTQRPHPLGFHEPEKKPGFDNIFILRLRRPDN